jgi:hypothetical protein
VDLDLFELRNAFGSRTPEEITAACQAVRPHIDTYLKAQLWLSQLIIYLLDHERPLAAALILFGIQLFDPRPKCVSTIFNAITRSSKIIILGSASSSKSYSCICYLILQYIRDPENVGVRIMSVSGAHSLAVTFSALQRFYAEAIIPLPGISQRGFLGLDPKQRHASISVLSIERNESGRQSLQGFHPQRRVSPHVKFGELSRTFVFVDECEMVSPSVFDGLRNVTSGISGPDTVKLILACNPRDPTSLTANYAMPPKGWTSLDPDTVTHWTSAADWDVTRVDAKYSRNVLEGKLVEHGLMTAEGYADLELRKDSDPISYWCYGRGYYALEGIEDNLVPYSYLSELSAVDSKPATKGRIKTSHFFRLNPAQMFWQGMI